MTITIETVRGVNGKVKRYKSFTGKKKEKEYKEAIDMVNIEAKKKAPKGSFFKSFQRAGFEVGKSAAQFGQVGTQPQEPFSQEQEAMRSMFGGGDKMWGTIGEPVTLNHDLNPRQRGDRGTAELFGF